MDLSDWQGAWENLQQVDDGKMLPPPKEGKLIFSVAGDRFSVKEGEKLIETGKLIIVDATSNPKRFDHMVDGKEGRVKGLFEISGDSLKACCAPEGKKLPSQIESTPGSGVWVGEYRRVK